MRVLRVCRFSTFALPPALPPCCCPLAFRRQVRRLTSRMSSESYPGCPECVVSCHGAGRLANSIRAVSCSAFSYSHTEKVPCENGLVETVPCRSLMVCTIYTSHPIVISYLIDRRCLSSMALLDLALVCLHALSVRGGTSRGELVCHRPVPIVISPMSPYCVWC